LIKYLTYWVAYSHLIPISLYVVLEMVKLAQANLIGKDVDIYDPETGFSLCRNSDLIEEMGQVQFIFSDKTGTLTCNVMEFKQCSIDGQIFPSLADAQRTFDLAANKSEKEQITMRACHEFFKLMAVCHTVVLDTDKHTGKQVMQAASPDELALVQGSVDVGFKFVEKTNDSIKIEIEYLKKFEKYTVLAEFPFDSTRKRMSLIVQEEVSKKIIIMTKGADSIMLPRTTISAVNRQVVDDHLYKFACSGLRTLVMAQKELNPAEFNAWNANYRQVLTSNTPDKEDKLCELYD
jgi:phospholipid-transporting ATPase